MTIEGKEPDVTRVQLILKVDRLERLVLALADLHPITLSGRENTDAIKQLRAEIDERDQRIRSE